SNSISGACSLFRRRLGRARHGFLSLCHAGKGIRLLGRSRSLFYPTDRLSGRICVWVGARDVDKRRSFAASGKLGHGSRAVRHTARELAAAFLRAQEDRHLLLEEGDRRRHSPGKLPMGHLRSNVLDVSGAEIPCCPTGEGTLHLLSGQASRCEIALRSAGTRQCRADRGNEDSPSLALGIGSGSESLASGRVLPRGALSSSRLDPEGPIGDECRSRELAEEAAVRQLDKKRLEAAHERRALWLDGSLI